MTQKPIVLFLRGVFIEDLNNINKSLALANLDISRESKYNEIPRKFQGIDKWIRETNIHCRYCTFQFKSVPVFLPEYITSDTDINIHQILFCGFPCAASYVTNNYTGYELQKMIHSLGFVYKLFTGGDNITNIPVAPNLSECEIFGGKNAKYTSQQFRDLVARLLPTMAYII